MKFTFSTTKPKAKDVANVVFSFDGKTRLAVNNERQTIEIDLGAKKDFTLRKYFVALRNIIQLAKKNKISKLVINPSDLVVESLNLSSEQMAEIIATNFEMANYSFDKYKTKPKGGFAVVAEVIVVGKIDSSIQKAFKQGQIIGQYVNDCRQLSNTPGGDITPSGLAKYAEAIGQKSGVRVNVLGLKKIEELKMGGVLGVGKGSDDEPKFIVMEYKNGGTQKPIVLVGKGVTFDSGGLSIKPGDFMYEMHMDMSGGSAVIHAICAAAKLKIKKNVIAIIPAVENMISGSSFRPGDILKTMSGITVEVLNTDAEGRLILADGLSYAKQFKPRLVVDVATLTGACMVAVGKHASGIFTKDHDLEMIFRDLGEQTGDYVWPLPLWEEYEEEIKGTFADINNAGKTRYGGASTAAAFLYQFAKDYPWVHVDIAPRMTASENEGLERGAAGAPVRLLIKLLQTY